MAKASIYWDKDYLIRIKCPGCECDHVLEIRENQHPHWTFNNNFEKPTFTPSLVVKTGKFVDPTFEDSDKLSSICHSFITDGRIQFLSDSTHPLAGQTVELPELNG